jgi:hypothetical protein
MLSNFDVEDIKRLRRDMLNHIDDTLATYATRITLAAMLDEEINKRTAAPSNGQIEENPNEASA